MNTRLLASIALACLPVVAAAAPPCAAPEHRQFDFWLGDWEVHTPDGKLAGSNHVTQEYAGCVLHEHYQTPGVFSGESLNAFDPGTRRWHQTWMDNTGTVLLLDGTLQDGVMVLEGQTTGTDGAVTRHRIRWTPSADGSVRQHWESTDASGAWTTAFDGRYTRRAAD